MNLFPNQQDKSHDYIEDWLVIGPYRNPSGVAEMSEDYLRGEGLELPCDGQPRLAGNPWRRVHASGGRFSFLSAGWPFTDYAIAYAHVYVHSLQALKCKLVVGSDDGIAVSLNGKKVFVCDVNRSWNPEQDVVDVELDPGWNRLLLKIRNGTADWVFSARFADEQGRPIKSLDYRLDNPDGAGRFGIPMRYADLDAKLATPVIDGDKVTAALQVSNLGDYAALEARLLRGQERLASWDCLDGGAVGDAAITLSLGEVTSVLSGESLEVQWKTASEFRRDRLRLARPIDWLIALGEAGIKPLASAETLEFARRASACVTMPDYGAELTEKAQEILSLIPQGAEAVKQASESGIELLKVVDALLSGVTIHLVAQSHVDMAWTWDWQETIDVVFPMTFGKALEMMKRHPDYKFTQNQVLGLAKAEEVYPDLFSEIAQRVREGRWETIGGQWLEPDSNMPSGESLARHLVLGQRYVHEKFGFTHKTAWCFDIFGHCWTLPQILARAGVENYLFGRCGKGYPVFWWEGPDGSRVLASHMRYGLPGAPLAEEAIRTIHDYNVHHMMFLFGGGDHGGGPNDADMEAIHDLQRQNPAPDVKISTGQAFFDGVRPEAAHLPVIREELNFQYPGCWTSQADMKVLNRRLEGLVYAAEAFSCAATLPEQRWRPVGYSKAELDSGVRTMLLNQFHDILPGSGIHATHVEASERYHRAIGVVQEVLDKCQRRIAGSVASDGTEIGVVVFNPLSWDRTDIVETEVVLPSAAWKQLVAVDPAGLSTSVQIVETQPADHGVRAKVIFLARDVPSVGYRTFWIRREKAAADMKVAAGKVTTERLEVVLDTKTGALKSLTLNGRECLAGNSNTLRAHQDKPENMSAWEIDLTGREAPVQVESVEVLESGPVRARLRVSTKFNQSRFSQDVIVYAGLDRVDCDFWADWHEREVLLAAHFLLDHRPDRAVYEIPYGWIERRGTGEEVPALSWVEVPGQSCGFALLNAGRYGFSYRDGALRMSVLRSPTDPDPKADEGEHRVRWSLLPHEGDFKSAGVQRRAHELNVPLSAVQISGAPGAGDQDASFLKITPDNVELGCWKRAEGSEELIIRVAETMGKAANVRVTMAAGIAAAGEVDIPELNRWPAQFRKRTLTFRIEPFQIRTFALRFDRPSNYA